MLDETTTVQKLAAEALGTAFLVFIGVGSVPATLIVNGDAPFTMADLGMISLAFGTIGPLPPFVKAETAVRKTLGAGLAATRLEVAVDGKVLVPHVQVPEGVGFGQEGAEDYRAPCVGRPHNVVVLMIVKRRFIIDIAAIGVRDRAKYARVIVEHQTSLPGATR